MKKKELKHVVRALVNNVLFPDTAYEPKLTDKEQHYVTKVVDKVRAKESVRPSEGDVAPA